MIPLVLIFGRRGCGKTSLARALVRAYPPEQIALQDPMFQFPEFAQDPIDWESVAPESFPPGTLVLADEIDLLCNPAGYQSPALKRIIHYGRHLGISLVGVSRRPANIHKDLTSLASTVYLGQITEPRDLGYCARAWGAQCYQARNLPFFKFLKITP